MSWLSFPGSPSPLLTSVTSAILSTPTSSNTDEFAQTTTATATGALPNPSLHQTATRLSNQTWTYSTPTVNQTLVYPTPTVNQTGLHSTSHTTPLLNVSATSTQNILTTSLINTRSITPSRATYSQSLLGSSVSQGKNSTRIHFSLQYQYTAGSQVLRIKQIIQLSGGSCLDGVSNFSELA